VAWPARPAFAPPAAAGRRQRRHRGQLEVSAHTLRHTAVGHPVLQAGVDVVVVAGLLGHSSLDTTRTYTRPSDRELAAAVEAGAVDYQRTHG
jgi:site-specific recombinase XerD